jgi:DNA-binding CsgD family transcriptional regulator
MNLINKGALEFNRSATQTLQSIVEPLFAHTGLTHFSYNKFSPGQRYLTLTLDTHMIEGFFNGDFDKFIFFENLKLPKHSKRVVYWDLQKDNDLLQFVRDLNYGHGITILIRHENEIETWSFATDLGNSEMNQLYLNHQTLLENFMISFQDKASQLINNTNQEKFAFYKDNQSLDFSVFDDTHCNHWEDSIKANKYPFFVNGQVVKLSQKEFECVKALSEGLCYKSIANKLGMSFRTVETHLNNSKTKLNVYSKEALLVSFKNSSYSKLIS